MNNLIHIENKNLLCILNDSGVILELTSKKENSSLVIPGDNLTGWKMISNVGPWREHPIYDTDNHAKVTASPTKVELFFDGLIGGNGLCRHKPCLRRR